MFTIAKVCTTNNVNIYKRCERNVSCFYHQRAKVDKIVFRTIVVSIRNIWINYMLLKRRSSGGLKLWQCLSETITFAHPSQVTTGYRVVRLNHGTTIRSYDSKSSCFMSFRPRTRDRSRFT